MTQHTGVNLLYSCQDNIRQLRQLSLFLLNLARNSQFFYTFQNAFYGPVCSTSVEALYTYRILDNYASQSVVVEMCQHNSFMQNNM